MHELNKMNKKLKKVWIRLQFISIFNPHDSDHIELALVRYNYCIMYIRWDILRNHGVERKHIIRSTFPLGLVIVFSYRAV